MGNSLSSSFGDTPLTFNEVTPLVHSGATSDCYKVKMWGRWFFLKRPKSAYKDDPKYIASFEKEFAIGILLDNENIVRYHSYGYDDEGMYILTDYFEGVTLSQFVEKKGTLTRKEIRSISLQIANALEYLHGKGIVHGDLKPDNIMVKESDLSVKLIDLGFSYSDCFEIIGKGSGGFSAPEQLRGEKADSRADIYSFGKVISYMGESFQRVASKASREAADERYQSMTDVIRALTPIPIKKYIPALLIILCTLLLIAIISSRNTNSDTMEALEPIVQETVREQIASQSKTVEECFKDDLDSVFRNMFNPFYERYPHVNNDNFAASRTEMQALIMDAMRKGDSLKAVYSRTSLDMDALSLDGVIRASIEQYTFRYGQECANLNR